MSESTSNVALLVSYDGRFFEGWQRHPGKSTVQGAIEDAVRGVFDVEGTIEGSGRTDRGAHALGQVASVRLPSELEDQKIVRRLNEALEGDVIIEDARHVADDFHARRSALGKTYRYALWTGDDMPAELERRVWHVHGELDVDAMAAAMPTFIGTHDFSSFASSGGFERASSVRTVTRSELFAEDSIVEMVFEAESFLYKMVRNLVRAVVRVGEGKRTSGDVQAMLEARDRKAAPGSAPASGLYLDSVLYDPPLFEQ